MSAPLPGPWAALIAEVNGRPLVGTPGVRDVDFPCTSFDGKTPDGSGRCESDGHYLCAECSHLSRLSDHGPFHVTDQELFAEIERLGLAGGVGPTAYDDARESILAKREAAKVGAP